MNDRDKIKRELEKIFNKNPNKRKITCYYSKFCPLPIFLNFPDATQQHFTFFELLLEKFQHIFVLKYADYANYCKKIENLKDRNSDFFENKLTKDFIEDRLLYFIKEKCMRQTDFFNAPHNDDMDPNKSIVLLISIEEYHEIISFVKEFNFNVKSLKKKTFFFLKKYYNNYISLSFQCEWLNLMKKISDCECGEMCFFEGMLKQKNLYCQFFYGKNKEMHDFSAKNLNFLNKINNCNCKNKKEIPFHNQSMREADKLIQRLYSMILEKVGFIEKLLFFYENIQQIIENLPFSLKITLNDLQKQAVAEGILKKGCCLYSDILVRGTGKTCYCKNCLKENLKVRSPVCLHNNNYSILDYYGNNQAESFVVNGDDIDLYNIPEEFMLNRESIETGYNAFDRTNTAFGTDYSFFPQNLLDIFEDVLQDPMTSENNTSFFEDYSDFDEDDFDDTFDPYEEPDPIDFSGTSTEDQRFPNRGVLGAVSTLSKKELNCQIQEEEKEREMLNQKDNLLFYDKNEEDRYLINLGGLTEGEENKKIMSSGLLCTGMISQKPTEAEKSRDNHIFTHKEREKEGNNKKIIDFYSKRYKKIKSFKKEEFERHRFYAPSISKHFISYRRNHIIVPLAIMYYFQEDLPLLIICKKPELKEWKELGTQMWEEWNFIDGKFAEENEIKEDEEILPKIFGDINLCSEGRVLRDLFPRFSRVRLKKDKIQISFTTFNFPIKAMFSDENVLEIEIEMKKYTSYEQFNAFLQQNEKNENLFNLKILTTMSGFSSLEKSLTSIFLKVLETQINQKLVISDEEISDKNKIQEKLKAFLKKEYNQEEKTRNERIEELKNKYKNMKNLSDSKMERFQMKIIDTRHFNAEMKRQKTNPKNGCHFDYFNGNYNTIFTPEIDHKSCKDNFKEVMKRSKRLLIKTTFSSNFSLKNKIDFLIENIKNYRRLSNKIENTTLCFPKVTCSYFEYIKDLWHNYENFDLVSNKHVKHSIDYFSSLDEYELLLSLFFIAF